MFTSNKPYTNTHIQFNKWDFELSDYQKWAIQHYLEDGNVLITAPTGSGKTLPAEFAMEHCVKTLGKKVIYTTPIIALSNEKFYSFKNKFPDISFGILTGPNKFNPDADVLIMTTEILNNTLFKKKIKESDDKIVLDFDIDIDNELGLVIYDEIHYINDKNRGKVWEESIIQIPKTVQMIGLSATINNPQKLCNLLHNSNGKNTYLCIHDKRVVPLEHYSFVTTTDSVIKNASKKEQELLNDSINKLMLIQNKNNEYNDNVYNKVSKTLDYFHKKRIYVNKYFAINKIVETCKGNDMLPALCYIFSQKQCQEYAPKITVPLFEENSIIPNIIEKECIKILSAKLNNYKEYIVLPEFTYLLNILKKGIAIHHAGMIPPFREMIELLYNKKYIKLLFATETFAIGINMPIRTVIYTSLQKFDGHSFRLLHSHEYAQGAGRAGRRGIDKKGYVIHANNIFNYNSYPDLYSYKKLMDGKPAKLNSRLNINLNIVLKTISAQKNINDFIENSMMMDELNKENKQLENLENENNITLQKMYNSIQNGKIDFDSLNEYYEGTQNLNLIKNKKKRKEKQRQMQMIADNKFFEKEYNKFIEYINLRKTTKEIKNELEHVNSYITNMFDIYLRILSDNEFVKYNNNKYSLTVKGKIACNIHEIHCLVISDIISSGCLNKLNVAELVSILSIFTDIRLSNNDKINFINETKATDDVKNIVIKIQNLLNKYHDDITSYKINTTENYDIHYDMCDYMYNWCRVDNEEECHAIYKDAKQWNISVGDFIKCIKKINNISEEMQKACIEQENLELLQLLKQVSIYTQKSIATNQSLYI